MKFGIPFFIEKNNETMLICSMVLTTIMTILMFEYAPWMTPIFTGYSYTR